MKDLALALLTLTVAALCLGAMVLSFAGGVGM